MRRIKGWETTPPHEPSDNSVYHVLEIKWTIRMSSIAHLPEWALDFISAFIIRFLGDSLPAGLSVRVKINNAIPPRQTFSPIATDDALISAHILSCISQPLLVYYSQLSLAYSRKLCILSEPITTYIATSCLARSSSRRINSFSALSQIPAEPNSPHKGPTICLP